MPDRAGPVAGGVRGRRPGLALTLRPPLVTVRRSRRIAPSSRRVLVTPDRPSRRATGRYRDRCRRWSALEGRAWLLFGADSGFEARTAHLLHPGVGHLHADVTGGCREAPSHHPGDTRLRGQAGDGVDPRGAVAAVPTAQAEREFCQTHAGMGAGMRQHVGGV